MLTPTIKPTTTPYIYNYCSICIVFFRDCILPNYPPNGKWVIIGGSDASPGSSVPINTIISFSCDEQYNISGEYSVIMCLGKDWNLPSPDCSSEYYLFTKSKTYSPIRN